MADKELKIGTEIIAKVGRNEVEAVIVEINGDNIMAKSHKSGKTFRVKTILKIGAIPQDEPASGETPKAGGHRRAEGKKAEPFFGSGTDSGNCPQRQLLLGR